MTRDEILAMEAGKGLDTLVANDLGVPYIVVTNKQEERLRYSTDISAAWQLLEATTAFTLQRLGLESSYSATLVFSRGMPSVVSDKTMPEAICKAALLAKLEAKGAQKETSS